MTDAEKALNGLDVMELFEHRETIRRALKIAAAVDGGGLVHMEPEKDCPLSTYGQGNNDLLERLRGIK